MKKTTKKKKPSVRKTILDIVPIRSISEKGTTTWMMAVTWICCKYNQKT